MPLDGRNFQVETKPDVFSLEGLIAWLEMRDPSEKYCFTDGRRCLLTRAGWSWPGTCPSEGTWPYIVSAGYLKQNDPATWTMGQALDRARKLLASRSTGLAPDKILSGAL